jgi:hypothetical protein
LKAWNPLIIKELTKNTGGLGRIGIFHGYFSMKIKHEALELLSIGLVKVSSIEPIHFA